MIFILFKRRLNSIIVFICVDANNDLNSPQSMIFSYDVVQTNKLDFFFFFSFILKTINFVVIVNTRFFTSSFCIVLIIITTTTS